MCPTIEEECAADPLGPPGTHRPGGCQSVTYAGADVQPAHGPGAIAFGHAQNLFKILKKNLHAVSSFVPQSTHRAGNPGAPPAATPRRLFLFPQAAVWIILWTADGLIPTLAAIFLVQSLFPGVHYLCDLPRWYRTTSQALALRPSPLSRFSPPFTLSLNH